MPTCTFCESVCSYALCTAQDIYTAAFNCHAVHTGNYFTDTLSALQHYPSWITTSGFIQQAGISQALASQTGGYTLFVPSVRAWKPVEPQVLTMSNAGIADLLRYHVVPGARQVPRDFKNGTLQTLLSGHTVTVATDPK